MPTDPNFSSVVLLVHFDGAEGATTFTDVSNSAHALTATANVTQTTTAAKFGATSLNFIGPGVYLSSADSDDWDFGSGQFTVEAWVRPTIALSGLRTVASQWTSSSDFAWWFGWNGTSLSFFYSTTGTDSPSIAGTFSPTLNDWTHVAVDRDASNVIRIYANGAVVNSATVSSTFFNSTQALRIGNDGNTLRTWVGQIDEIRITKGLARYGGAFTPPTNPFPDNLNPNLQISDLVREFVVTDSDAALNIGGLVREFVVSPGVGANQLLVSGLVREFVVVPANTSPIRKKRRLMIIS